MHRQSLEHMKINIDKYLSKPGKVLDVGSTNVRGKGCYKQILTDEYDYIGLDLQAGINVDVVIDDPYVYPFDDNTFDAVFCGQVVEHCENPFKLINECYRVLKPGGIFFGVAPFKWEVHGYPLDCWRILPDGWCSLFKEAGFSSVLDTYFNTHDSRVSNSNVDCWGIAKK